MYKIYNSKTSPSLVHILILFLSLNDVDIVYSVPSSVIVSLDKIDYYELQCTYIIICTYTCIICTHYNIICTVYNCGTILPSSSTSPTSIDWYSELGKVVANVLFTLPQPVHSSTCLLT